MFVLRICQNIVLLFLPRSAVHPPPSGQIYIAALVGCPQLLFPRLGRPGISLSGTNQYPKIRFPSPHSCYSNGPCPTKWTSSERTRVMEIIPDQPFSNRRR